MGGLDAGNRCLSRCKGFEAQHRSGQLLYEAMVLLNDVVEIFHLQHFDQPVPTDEDQLDVHVVPPGQVRAALVDDHLVWPAVISDRLGEERGGRSFVAALGHIKSMV